MGKLATRESELQKKEEPPRKNLMGKMTKAVYIRILQNVLSFP